MGSLTQSNDGEIFWKIVITSASAAPPAPPSSSAPIRHTYKVYIAGSFLQIGQWPLEIGSRVEARCPTAAWSHRYTLLHVHLLWIDLELNNKIRVKLMILQIECFLYLLI